MADPRYQTCVAANSFVRDFANMGEALPLSKLSEPLEDVDLVTRDPKSKRYAGVRFHKASPQGQQALLEIAFTRRKLIRVTADQEIITRFGPKPAHQLEPGVDKCWAFMPGEDEPKMITVVRVTPVGTAKVARVTAMSDPYNGFVNDVLVSMR